MCKPRHRVTSFSRAMMQSIMFEQVILFIFPLFVLINIRLHIAGDTN